MGRSFSQAKIARGEATRLPSKRGHEEKPTLPTYGPAHALGLIDIHPTAQDIQPKLTVNEPGDASEREADRVADEVMRMPEPSRTDVTEQGSSGTQSQRGTSAGKKPGNLVAPHIVHEVVRSPGQPLDPAIRSFMEPRFGHDFSSVRVHTDARSAHSASALDALAYTVGDNLVFGTGRYSTATDAGKKLLAHELTHVVQQRSGATQDGVQRERSMGRSTIEAPASVQRLSQPVVKPAPEGAISIRAFILLVEAEEAKWPIAEQTQTSLMISRLRKIFYGTSGWDKYLIPGASGIDSGYSIHEEETGRENLSLIGPDADIVRKRQVLKDQYGMSPTISRHQEVRLEDGTFDDIGHVFAGLDAANHFTDVSAGLGLASVKDNKAAVTWTGDLGSAVTEIIFKAQNSGAPTAVTAMQGIVDEYASAQDMLGNIDAYVIADQYDISNSGGKKVSELLRAYYLGEASTPDTRARANRFSRFCALIGLKGWADGHFANEAAWLDRWTPEVAGAAALYYGATTSGIFAIPGRAGSISAVQDSTYIARLLLQNFLDELKVQVAAEAP